MTDWPPQWLGWQPQPKDDSLEKKLMLKYTIKLVERFGFDRVDLTFNNKENRIKVLEEMFDVASSEWVFKIDLIDTNQSSWLESQFEGNPNFANWCDENTLGDRRAIFERYF